LTIGVTHFHQNWVEKLACFRLQLTVSTQPLVVVG